MKLPMLLTFCLLASTAFAADVADKTPPVVGELAGTIGRPMQFGARKNGMRIGLSSEKKSYHLNHRINVWCSFETVRELTEYPAVKDNFLLITHPDGTISKDPRGWPWDGPRGAQWMGGMSDVLHRVIRKPGEYKLQWKCGDMESGIVIFTIVP